MTRRRILAFVAIAFGLLTVVAGGRVLAGADPEHKTRPRASLVPRHTCFNRLTSTVCS